MNALPGCIRPAEKMLPSGCVFQKQGLPLVHEMNILPETAFALSSRSGTNLPAALTLAGRKNRRCGCFFQNIHFMHLGGSPVCAATMKIDSFFTAQFPRIPQPPRLFLPPRRLPWNGLSSSSSEPCTGIGRSTGWDYTADRDGWKYSPARSGNS